MGEIIFEAGPGFDAAGDGAAGGKVGGDAAAGHAEPIGYGVDGEGVEGEAGGDAVEIANVRD